MNTNKVDVSLNYYGKPYQTLVTLLTLWKHSSQHIDTIYLVIEKQQPYAQYGVLKMMQWALRHLPLRYYYATHFYYAGSPPLASLNDPEKRYGLKYQYGLEKTDKKFHFLTHNDCLYKDDLLGMMRDQVSHSVEDIAGVGMVGQCWNCPAFFAKVCDSSRFEHFQPTSEELRSLVDQYHPPRAAIHYDLIEKGYVYPLPECRLNEYACLVNSERYQQLTRPQGEILPLGASWHGTDWGAIWFHDMVNAGYKFINFPFEPHMVHAPFTPSKSGHKSDKDPNEYFKTEENARQYLQQEFPEALVVPAMVKFSAFLSQCQATAQRFPGKARRYLRSLMNKK
jgi:hypothetical protein